MIIAFAEAYNLAHQNGRSESLPEQGKGAGQVGENSGNNSNGAKAPTMRGPEYESSVAQSSGSKSEGQFSCVRKRFEDAFDGIVMQLRENWRVKKQPTKFELALQLFRDNPEAFVTFDKLRPLFENSSDVDHAVWVFIYGLNTKLKDYGLRIETPRAYRLVAVDAEPQTLETASQAPDRELIQE